MPAHLIAKEGPLAGLVLSFEEGDDWIIGRDPDVADLLIEDATVSRKHARVIKTPQGYFLQNLSRTNPILINGEAKEERTLLHEGDLIQIGNHTFGFSQNEIPEEEELPRKKKKKSPKKETSGYDDIFGDQNLHLEEPPPPSRDEEVFSAKEETPALPYLEPPRQEEKTAYDTIFEDLDDNQEIPFHFLQPALLLLKVISGPNAGAEIGIEKGKSYVIGKDSNSCDIVFQDLSVSRNHARLSVSADGVIELEDLGSKNGTSVNGALITEKTVVTAQDIIALGTTVFLIIDREAPQETIYSPIVPSFEQPKEAAPAIAVEETEPPKDLHWKQVPLPKKHLIIGAAFAAMFLIVFLSFFSLFKSHGIDVAKKEPVSQIKEALAKFDDVAFSFNPGSGKLFVTGHVISGIDYQEMMYRIEQIPFVQSVDNTVVIDELVWKMTNDILSTMPNFRTVSIHSPKAGSFVAVGYVASAADSALLNEYLTVNFPYIDRLKNNVAVEETLTVEVQNILRSHGFGGIAFQLTGGDLLLTGSYNKEKKSNYEDVLKTLNQLPGISRVRDIALAGGPDAAAINITQNYKVGGSASTHGHGYSVVLNNKIYTIGESVDGMNITSIGEKTIFLEKDGLNYRIDYK